MRWSRVKSLLMPRVVSERPEIGAEWVNGCWVAVGLRGRSGVVGLSDVEGWRGIAGDDARFLAGAEMCGSVLTWAVSNLELSETVRPTIRGMVCGAGVRASGLPEFDCMASDVCDGFAASRLLLPSRVLWGQACWCLGHQTEFWAAIPCDDCMAVFRTEGEARRLLSQSSLRSPENRRPISFEPFILTRDGVAGVVG